MYIQPLPSKLAPAGAQHLNFLWKDAGTATYIMDNHLGALWCWLNELDGDEEYSFFHLDWHWDCTDMPDVDIVKLAKPLDFQSFKALRSSADSLMSLVRYDNYIDPLFFLRTNTIEVHITSNQDKHGERVLDSNIYPDFRIYDHPEFFIARLRDNLENLPKGRILFNLDIDFFFLRVGGQLMQAYSEDLISAVVSEVAQVPTERRVVTVAWSPEHSGSWSGSGHVCELICGALGIACPAADIIHLPH